MASSLDNAAYQRRQLLREISVRKQAIEALKGYSFKPEEGRTVIVHMGGEGWAPKVERVAKRTTPSGCRSARTFAQVVRPAWG
jgi:hypothetical protein